MSSQPTKMKFGFISKKKKLEAEKLFAEEEETKKVYEEFVNTFDQTPTTAKTFVRGNTISSASGKTIDSSNAGDLYKADKMKELDRKRQEEHKKSRDRSSDRSKDRQSRSRSRDRDRRSRSRSREHRSRSRERDRDRRSRSRDRDRDQSRDRSSDRSRDRDRSKDRDSSRSREKEADNRVSTYMKTIKTVVNQKPALKKGDAPKKKSNLEIFKDELKQKHEDKNGRANHANLVSIRTVNNSNTSNNNNQNDDMNTTNIYAGNLNSSITEQIMKEIFGLFGSLASVKIMYPRTQEEREKNRGRLSGFIAFMFRKDAVNAMKALDGMDIMDHKIKLGWGKGVNLPQFPCYVPTVLRPLNSKELKNYGLPFYAQIENDEDRQFLESYGDARALIRENKEKFYEILGRTTVYVKIPEDRQILSTINRVCEFVIREGAMFEANLMVRESQNHKFRFLYDICSEENAYYRWRLFSLLQGDSINDWRMNEFTMFKGGSVWKPPQPPKIEITDDLLPSPEELWKHLRNSKEFQKPPNDKGILCDEDREMLEELVRNLTPVKDEIAGATVFCIDHAECWEEIVQCLKDSLTLRETPLFKKLARLYLISDVLSNCTAKVSNVSYYRLALQEILGIVFESFHECYDKIESRLKAEQFKTRVMSVIRYWQEQAMFNQDLLIQLQNIFLGLTSNWQEDKNGSEDLNHDLDGVPLDGEPIQEDIDGVPFEQSTMFTKSKWESVT